MEAAPSDEVADLVSQVAKLEKALAAVGGASPPQQNGQQKGSALKGRLQKALERQAAFEPSRAATSAAPMLRQGMRCSCGEQRHMGIIQFVGPIPSLGPGQWVGVQLDEAVGSHNGHVHGRHLFDCPAKHGQCYRVADVSVQDEPLPPGAVEALASGVGSRPTAAKSIAAGRGLETAVVNQVSQFLITACDELGHRVQTGGDPFSVFVHGVHPPCRLRVKLHDHGDGYYTGEYKAEVSGTIEVAITLKGQPIAGSPFHVNAVTLQAQPSNCVLRGDALTSAVARKPMQFEIDFVDALGNPAVAEELDVRLEPFVPLLPSVEDHSALHGGAGSEEDAAALLAAQEERLATEGVVRIRLQKGVGLLAADLNGKSDPYVVLQLGELVATLDGTR